MIPGAAFSFLVLYPNANIYVVKLYEYELVCRVSFRRVVPTGAQGELEEQDRTHTSPPGVSLRAPPRCGGPAGRGGRNQRSGQRWKQPAPQGKLLQWYCFVGLGLGWLG